MDLILCEVCSISSGKLMSWRTLLTVCHAWSHRQWLANHWQRILKVLSSDFWMQWCRRQSETTSLRKATTFTTVHTVHSMYHVDDGSWSTQIKCSFLYRIIYGLKGFQNEPWDIEYMLMNSWKDWTTIQTIWTVYKGNWVYQNPSIAWYTL